MIRGVVNHFNRGEIDQRALAREDLKRINQSASLMRNFVPTRLGPMIYRPGTEYLATLNASNTHRMVGFINAVDDTAILDFNNDTLEFIVNDVVIQTTAVTSVFTNGTFTTDITGWTDDSGGAASTAWYDYGGGDGALALTGDGTSNAVSYQTIASTDTDEEHFMRVVIDRAPVGVKIGTSGNGSSDVFSGTLKQGEHVLTYTPSGNITVTFENSKKYRALVDSISFDAGGLNLAITTPMLDAGLISLREEQSGDIIYAAHDNGRPFQVEHRGDKSWSVVDYLSDDGPFESINISNISMTPAALNGDTTLTASDDFFQAGHVGDLFKVGSSGQIVQTVVSVDTGAGTGSIEVVGIGASRAFVITISGIVTTVTVTLQRSPDDLNWEDVLTYTTNQSATAYNDGFDNAVLYYRLYIKAGDNGTPDTVTLKLNYPSGSIEGIGRVTEYTSATVVNIQVLRDFGATDASLDWYEGSWSGVPLSINDNHQYPGTVSIAEGRLWFGGDEEIWGSVSDAYYSFDREIVGDSRSILRTIGFGPRDPIKWIVSTGQLIVGTSGDELVVKTSSFGEVLTQSTAVVRSGSTQGSGDVEPIKIDGTIYFVQRSGAKIFSLDNYSEREKFETLDATMLNQSLTSAGVIRLAVARQPETRVFAVLNDGNAVVYTVDAAEEVAGWSRLTTNGNVKDIVILPETGEDRVYFVVERGSSYYLEKMAKFSDSEGGNVSETFDGFIRYTSPGQNITGLDIHIGETVGVWADGQDRGTYTVSPGGTIFVSDSWTDVIVGLPYEADYISNKLSGYEPTTVMTERKRIVDTGLILMNYFPGALKVGPNESLLKPLPGIEDGKPVDTTATITDYSEVPFEFDGETESDPRIYLRATGPCTILALTYGIEEPNTPAGNQG